MYRSRIVLGSLAILASVAAFPGAARADIIKPPAGTTMTIGVGETYTLPQNGGTFAVGEWNNSGSTLNQTGGLIQDEATSGVWGTYGVGRSNGTGHYNMSGGVLSLPGLNGASAAYSFSVGGGWDSSCYGEFNLSGTAVANIGSLTVGVGTGSGLVTLSGGASLTLGVLGYAGAYDAAGIGNGYFTFASGSAATLTITGKNLAYYTDLVSGANAGKIRVGGAVQSDFSNFQVTGNTLSVIPEPGTLHLLGIAGLGLLIRRRRMQPGYRRRA